MRIIYGLNNLKSQREKTTATIGIFDGVHTGHQRILKELVKQAKARRQIAAVLTFHPHPKKVLSRTSSKATITSLDHRLKLFDDIGIDLCVVIEFTRVFSRRPIGWFIRNILVGRLKTTTLIVGSGFKLGKKGLPATRLKRLAKDYGLNLKIIPAQKHKGKIISSSSIRNLIEKGRLDTASKLLGGRVSIYGTVISGKRRGRVIGFKTANIDPHHEVIPPSGVYAVKVRLGKKYYKGVLNIGFRPTFESMQKEPTIEVHILNFHGKLYKKLIELSFIKKIRPERRFKNKEALQAQIKRDIQSAFSLYKV